MKFVSKNNGNSIIFPLSSAGNMSFFYARDISFSRGIIGFSSSMNQNTSNPDHSMMMLNYYNGVTCVGTVDIRSGCTFRGVSK
mgnify:CR=1 FL=1